MSCFVACVVRALRVACPRSFLCSVCVLHGSPAGLSRSGRDPPPSHRLRLERGARPYVLDSANDATRGDLGQSIAAGSGCTQRRSSPHEDDTFMGWFALTSREADALPRAMYARRRPGGGFYYLYRADAFDRAATVVAADAVADAGTSGGDRQRDRAVRRGIQREVRRLSNLAMATVGSGHITCTARPPPPPQPMPPPVR